jgi:hypothetical protein
LQIKGAASLDDKRKSWPDMLWRAMVIALWSVREIARTAWSIARIPVMHFLQILAALIVLFEEWGWKPLSRALAWLARFAPIAALERWIAGLPPYGALMVFALPTAFLLPLKFIAMWLLANGKWWTATALFAGAKVASTAIIARIFILTKPALMRIGWFARAYDWFVPWKDALFAQIRASWIWRYGRMVKTRVRLEVKQAWIRWRPLVVARWRAWAARGHEAWLRIRTRISGRSIG